MNHGVGNKSHIQYLKGSPFEYKYWCKIKNDGPSSINPFGDNINLFRNVLDCKRTILSLENTNQSNTVHKIYHLYIQCVRKHTSEHYCSL